MVSTPGRGSTSRYYLHILVSEVKGSSSGLSDPLDREIDFDFDFDFDSFVRGGRGEAVCACETCLLDAGADLSGVVRLLAAGL